VHVAVSKEYTMSGSKLEFMGVVWTQIGPAGTSKHSETRVVSCVTEKFVECCVVG
jgi:hypothetical protein